MYGQPVTLTATLTPATATGQVTFYDGTAVLGDASLSGGKAVLQTRLLPAGGRSLRAYYPGDSNDLPSTSAWVPQTVNAQPAGGFLAAKGWGTGTGAYSVAVGDFNGDGNADLAVANYSAGTVTVLLGNGDGTFRAGVDYGAGSNPISVAIGDFNGDGKADLAVANSGYGTVSILLGNGDGTFHYVAGYWVALNPVSVACGDFNGDGKVDLAVANAGSNYVNVLLGKGDGTFQIAVNYAAGSWPNSVAVGDFNGDGKADLAVADWNGNNVSVLLGNGDGTFQTATAYAAGGNAGSVAVGDFNRDGKADLAVANYSGGNVSVLLGNGNGTFQAAVNYPAGADPSAVAVGDFNGDGKLDLAVANAAGGNLSVLLGKGDGTFQAASNYSTGSNPQSVATGDFNGDGRADLAVANFLSNNVSVLLGAAPRSPFDFDRDGHADVIWEEPKVGWAQVWYLDCPACSPPLGAANLTKANPWNIVGIGDFDGNGYPDVVWQDPVSGAVQVWYLGSTGGVTLLGAANITTKNPWRVVSIADFNQDGHPDLLWQDTASGHAQIWYLGGPQGITLLGAVDLTKSNSWNIVGTGDFNRDGYPDVLWQDPASGTVQIWYMGGATAGAQGSVLQSAVNLTGPMTTKVVAVADFDNDGYQDVIFQDRTTGAATVYFYTGSQGITPNGTAVLSTGNPWYIAGPH